MVGHLNSQGYAIAAVHYSLILLATVEEQVTEAASTVGYLVKNAARLDLDPRKIIHKDHSPGAPFLTLLGTE